MQITTKNLIFNNVYLIKSRMYQPHQPSFHQDTNENQVIELEKRLMLAWQERKVEDYYQSIILNYLDRVSPDELEHQIAKEIKATHLGQSYYFKLNNTLNRRQKAISKLQKLLNQGKDQNSNKVLPNICEQIKSLRDSNLQCAETIVQLHRQYGQKEDNLSPQEQQILLSLDEENAFLKESFLKHYIFFQNGYDPFFLYHYDLRGRKRPASAHPAVDKIFNLNVSYACRLFKTKKQLLSIISSGKTNEIFSIQSPTYQRRRANKLIPSQDKTSSRYQNLNSERESQSRKTSVNFRSKPLSLQNAIQRDMLKHGVFPKNDEKQQKPRKRKLHTIGHDSLDQSDRKRSQLLESIDTAPYKNSVRYSDEADFDQKIKPKRYAANPPIFIPDQNQNLYRLVPLQTSPKKIKKKKSVNDYDQAESLLQSPHWKVKLEPIAIKKPQTIQEKNSKPKLPAEQQLKKRQSPKQPTESEAEDSQQQKYPKRQTKKVQEVQQKSKGKMQNSDVPSRKLQNNKQSDKNKKQIKMRPGVYSYSELIKYLKGLRLQQKVGTKTIFNPKWEQSISKIQSYFCQFIQGNQLKVVALCVKTVQGPYSIKLWAPLIDCSLQTSKFLFQKYIQYIQRQTSQQQIFYNGQQLQELQSLNFVQTKQNLHIRKRVFQASIKNNDFQLFLSLKCSSIVFSQENNKTNILYSQQIQSFSKETTFILPQIGRIQKQELSPELQMLVKINQGLQDMKTLNGLLQDQGFDTYQVDSKLKITNIKALGLSVTSAFKSIFLAGEGFIRLNGLQLVKNRNEALYKVACLKNNIFIYFGKGFANCSKFVQNTQKQGSKMSDLDVKMFSKELYGRLPIQGEGCYGNWQISLWWQDELQGRVRHNMGNNQSFGPDPFFTGVEIEGKLVYAFQVKKDDLLL